MSIGSRWGDRKKAQVFDMVRRWEGSYRWHKENIPGGCAKSQQCRLAQQALCLFVLMPCDEDSAVVKCGSILHPFYLPLIIHVLMGVIKGRDTISQKSCRKRWSQAGGCFIYFLLYPWYIICKYKVCSFIWMRFKELGSKLRSTISLDFNSYNSESTLHKNQATDSNLAQDCFAHLTLISLVLSHTTLLSFY